MVCACSADHQEDSNSAALSSTASPAPTALPTEQPSAETENPFSGEEPPPSLDFYKLDELREFIHADELSDADFERFVKENQYDSCGIQSKADLKAMVKRLDRIPFPNSDKYKFSCMDFYPEWGRSTIVCLMGEGHCYFTYSELNADSAASKLEEIAESYKVSSVEIRRSPSIRKLYVLDDIKEFFPENPSAW